MDIDPGARTRVSLATTAREVADRSRGVIGDVSTAMRPGERIRAAREVRLHALLLVADAVAVERADGASWESIAVALGLAHPGMTDAELDEVAAAARRQYGGGPLAAWDDDGVADEHRPADGGGLADQAAALDAYYVRHEDPWAAGGTTSPVSDALRAPRSAP